MKRKHISDMEQIDAQIDALRDAVRSGIARAGVAGATSDVMTLGQLIWNERRRRGMSLQEVAAASGMTKSHVWELEDDRSRNPTVKAIHGISKALGVPFLTVCRCALRSVEG